MSMYEIDPRASDDTEFVVVKLSGRAEAATILRLLGELSALAERNASLRVLIDETGLGAGFVGPADIHRIIDAWRKATALHSTRIAVFASSLAIYGLNRMFQGLAGRGAEGHISVFTEKAPARAWLLKPELQADDA
jgi:hypothetical protein